MPVKVITLESLNFHLLQYHDIINLENPDMFNEHLSGFVASVYTDN